MAALQSGWSQMNRGAAEVVAAATASPGTPLPQDVVDIRSSGSPVDTEPMLAGIRDMMLARQQISAGAMVLHVYDENRQTLYDMLKPDHDGDST